MYVVKPRCKRCNKVLREDRTCQNPKCVRYVPEKKVEPEPVVEKPVENEVDKPAQQEEHNGENTAKAD